MFEFTRLWSLIGGAQFIFHLSIERRKYSRWAVLLTHPPLNFASLGYSTKALQ
jgi:hypothetical protein